MCSILFQIFKSEHLSLCCCLCLLMNEQEQLSFINLLFPLNITVLFTIALRFSLLHSLYRFNLTHSLYILSSMSLTISCAMFSRCGKTIVPVIAKSHTQSDAVHFHETTPCSHVFFRCFALFLIHKLFVLCVRERGCLCG